MISQKLVVDRTSTRTYTSIFEITRPASLVWAIGFSIQKKSVDCCTIIELCVCCTDAKHGEHVSYDATRQCKRRLPYQPRQHAELSPAAAAHLHQLSAHGPSLRYGISTTLPLLTSASACTTQLQYLMNEIKAEII